MCNSDQICIHLRYVNIFERTIIIKFMIVWDIYLVLVSAARAEVRRESSQVRISEKQINCHLLLTC